MRNFTYMVIIVSLLRTKSDNVILYTIIVIDYSENVKSVFVI